MKAIKRWLQALQLFLFIFLTTTVSAQLVADFSASSIAGCPPLIVNFQDQSTGNPTSWKWDLGNGTQSSIANPVGTYFDPGTYTVKLVVRNSNNDADSIVRTQYITVHALPSPAFTASDTAGCFPLKVQFTEGSTAGSGNISSWQWDFGDGNLSSLPNPSHTYTTQGSFTVILRVVNSNGCSRVITRSSYIKTSAGVKAGFSYVSGLGCQPPTPVTFTNSSTGTGTLSYQWSFGDGKTSTLTDPINSYLSAGTYTVKLVATSTSGCTDTLVKQNTITIGTVNANFTTPPSVCAGAAVTFTNTSTPNSVGAVWYFSDGTTSTEINPKKGFATPGTYQVKLVNDFGSCRDSVTKTITVIAKPTASFTASNTIACKFPFTVSFTNTATGATSYRWNFGNGSTSTLPNPTHTYNRAGTFKVTLIVTNAAGCTDTFAIPDLVKITPPKITAINNLNVRGCLPYTLTPFPVIESTEPITSYFWSFGDGNTSTSATPTHIYTTPGIFNVKLVIVSGAGCMDSLQVNSAVTVGPKPTANFSGTPLDVCAYIPVNFTDLSTGGPISQHFWEFGDGGTSTLANPIHNYGDTGKFNVTLIVFNFGCADTLEIKNYVYVRPPLAKFDTTFVCNEPLKRNFVDESIDAHTWAWEFGDGNTSTLQNPTHTYAAPGVYKVRLTVTNGSCHNTQERDVVVIKENGIVTASDSLGCRNADISFEVTNTNSLNIHSYTWHFDGINGNGSTTSHASASKSYTVAGKFTAAVVLSNLLGCKDTLFIPVPINIYGPKTYFMPNVSGTCSNNNVVFIDSTVTDGAHPLTSWRWDFGDSTVVTYNNPPFNHTYLANGSYDVKLVVEDSYGCKDSLVKPAVINISKPVAGFTSSDTLLCPSSSISFSNTSTGGFLVNYLWHFGDGNTSTNPNPTHTYTSQGSFIVKLVMTDMYGCADSTSKTIQVYTPIAGFAMSDSFSSCPPLLVDFTNQSQHYVALNWDFGDGGNSQLVNPSRMYTYPGIYKVKLLVQNNGGCIDTITKTITIQGPTGVFTYSPTKVCTQGTVSFEANTQNTVKYIWDFNDGNTDFSAQQTATHHYSAIGNYLPKLILEDASGCRVPIVGTDTIKVLGVETYILSQNRVLCDSGLVLFQDSTISNDAISSYQWNFGDGGTASISNPSHNFSNTGWYNITLITTTAFGCADTAVFNNYIKIVASPQVQILGDTAACEPALLTFQGGFTIADTSAVTWNWSFGNGNASALQNPVSQSYADAGTYPIQLIVTNSDGCTSTVQKTALIHPKPIVDAGLDTTICKFNSYTLNATGASTYTWSSNATLSCLNCPSPDARPLFNDTYFVTGTSSFGCINTDSIVVKVKQPFSIKVSKDDTLCVGETRQLLATGAELYSWTPAAGLDNPTIGNPKSKADSTTVYKVVGYDDHNCFRDSGYIKVTVFPIPKIDILNGDEITLMVGKTVKLNTKSSPDVTNWRWQPATNLNCTTCPEPDATPSQNITYAVLASNDGRCIARDQITINLICDNANIYVPNTFSPNDDGMNDVFYPRGTGLYTIRTMRVFNRWGQLVYEKNNISPNNAAQGWDGKHNGIKVQSDVYVYVLEAVCANNTIVPIKGNITLLR